MPGDLATNFCEFDNIYLGCLGFVTVAIGSLFVVEFALRRLDATKQKLSQSMVASCEQGQNARETALTVEMVHEERVKRIDPIDIVPHVIKRLLLIVAIVVSGLVLDAIGKILLSFFCSISQAVTWVAIVLHTIFIIAIVWAGISISKRIISSLSELRGYEQDVDKLIENEKKDKNEKIKDLIRPASTNNH
ncbi:MAG: hypothetical protein PHN84_14455 [Desulfuromonadaceae bacterium]|nr:hypothetical protein [Desulfuromonadaceae bacterium]MDD2856785.1 hypothetical protein [Desulfuromonadaceae bacterium]